MKIIKVDVKNPQKEAIKKATEVLKIGGVVVYPTETLYGLGANPFDEQALQKVFEIKGRDLSKPISLAFRDIEHVKRFAEINSTAEKIIKKFLPGPLTIILTSKLQLDDILGGNKIGVRIPDNKVALELLKEVKFPLTSTSANLSGSKNPETAKEAINQIGEKVDLVLDAGKCKYGKPSTVVDLSSGEIEVVREGIIGKKELLKLI